MVSVGSNFKCRGGGEAMISPAECTRAGDPERGVSMLSFRTTEEKGLRWLNGLRAGEASRLLPFAPGPGPIEYEARYPFFC